MNERHVLRFQGSLAKCAAGGRDHSGCCVRRGVAPKCQSLCRGLVPQPPVDCLAYGGNIIQCFEEGTESIPGPVENLRATRVTRTSITLEWAPNDEDSHRSTNSSKKTNNVDFIVQYGKVNNMTLYETVVKMENVSVPRSFVRRRCAAGDSGRTANQAICVCIF